MPLDAAVILPGGETIGIVRQGRSADRTGFSKRLWRLRHGPLPGTILMLMPDEVRLRHARRLLTRTPMPALFGLEREAVIAEPDDPVWQMRSINADISLRSAIDRMDRRGTLPVERPLARVSLPPDTDERASGGDSPDYLLSALLKPAEKRTLDLLADWPWLDLRDLAGMLGVSRSRASQIVAAIEGFGLVVRAPTSGRRLAITDPGLAMLARRDRTAVGRARKRWSAAPASAGDWRTVSGRRSRQLLRDVEHTSAVHGFMAGLARQARALGWEIAQLDPPPRASRYFRLFGGMRSIHPDAFGLLATWTTPCGLSFWSGRDAQFDRSPWPQRLAPYLRYYSTHRPIDDHGAWPVVLVVFDEELAATHFLRVAVEEMAEARAGLPLLISHRGLLEHEGPLGRAWLAPGEGWEPKFPLLQPTTIQR